MQELTLDGEPETKPALPAFSVTPLNTALRCLFVAALHQGAQVPPEFLADVDAADIPTSVVALLRKVGLSGKILSGGNWRRLVSLKSSVPIMALRKDGYWVLVVNFADDAKSPALTVLDPLAEAAGVTLIPREEFLATWSGVVILCRKVKQASSEPRPFGLSWFLPEILLQKRYLRDVAVAAMMSNLIAFGTPLMFQILIDKVVSHRSYQTLTSLILIFGVLTLFDGVFNYVRQYLMLFLTSKIDARLASRTFRHLLSLPLTFFESTTAGILTRHMQQTDTIRNFLTGRLFQTLLDASAVPVLLVVLTLYSVRLTAVVLAFSLVIAALIGIMVPTLRRLLEQLYEAEGARQGHLVETIHGMPTVKSLALEPARVQTWDDKVALGVRRRLTVGRFAALAAVVTQMLQQFQTIAILGLGTLAVFDGSISIGALVAFNMICGRVTGPLVQIVGLINQYQEAALSVTMLGTVMRHPPERDPELKGIAPVITGRLEFDQVTFRYPGAATNALDRVAFSIDEGQVIGVVGRSGSGKTTVTRLIQGIHSVQEGVVRLDGVDIRNIDLPHLRRSIGVVLQENFLFRGSVRANIAAARPDATLAEIVAAAQLAGAEEFIERLPFSYETLIEENGANFSGGQRQRIAIARALLVQPRLLIFDEATSALDPESEAIVQQHLADIARGRTLIIVSHRLSSLVHADAIVMLERGKVVGMAPHTDLLQGCEAYRRLWQTQTRHLQ